MIREIDKRISRAMAGVRQAFRAVITRVSSGRGVQLVQGEGLAGEPFQDVELFQHYGHASNPPPGTMAIVVPAGGRSSHNIIIATEHGSYRIDLKPGEAAMYSDEGDSVHLKRGRIIEVTTRIFRVNAEEEIELNTPRVRASHQLVAEGLLSGNGGMAIKGGGDGQTATIDGTVVATVDVVASNVSLAGHTHTGDSGGVTSEPIQR